MSLLRSGSRSVASTAVSYSRRSAARAAKINLRHLGGTGRTPVGAVAVHRLQTSIAASTGSCGTFESKRNATRKRALNRRSTE
jgi:hypothetical protein